MAARRFPPPFTVHELNEAVFVIRDANGVTMSWTYYVGEGFHQLTGGKLTREEARVVAFGIARLLNEAAAKRGPTSGG
jgi:hypothetical protein